MRRTRIVRTALWAALAALGPGTSRAEIVLNPQGWRFPNIVTSAKEVIQLSDRTPLIPGRETLTKGYRKADGTHFLTYEIEGRVFGVAIDTDGKPPFEYSIMDTDCDGKFETKIIHGPGNTDRAYVPQCIIDWYYTVHPELKNAAPGTKVPKPSLVPPKVPAQAMAPAPPRPPAPAPEVRDRPNP